MSPNNQKKSEDYGDFTLMITVIHSCIIENFNVGVDAVCKLWQIFERGKLRIRLRHGCET